MQSRLTFNLGVAKEDAFEQGFLPPSPSARIPKFDVIPDVRIVIFIPNKCTMLQVFKP